MPDPSRLRRLAFRLAFLFLLSLAALLPGGRGPSGRGGVDPPRSAALPDLPAVGPDGGGQGRGEAGGGAWLARGFFSSPPQALIEPIDRDWLDREGGEARARPLAIQSLDAPAWSQVEARGGLVLLSGLGGAAQGGTA
jgi:hypothetical protein